MGRRNIFFKQTEPIAPAQIELAFYIRAFRRINELSLEDMANICTEYGSHNGVKFNFSEISNYERYKTVPSEKKFQILLDTMHIEREDLKR